MIRLILSSRRKMFFAAIAAVVTVLGVDMASPPPIERASETSPLVLDREGRWVHAFTTTGGRWRFAANLDEIDPLFIERLIAVEDKRFLSHNGVDLASVARAAWQAAEAGRVVSGASTITMQTARLLEPRPRTINSKLIEMARAWQIERRLTKREILELYLTLTPYGGNLEGLRAASLSYFGKEPLRLTDAEQALLIALPQAPEARRPDRRGEGARKSRADILDKLALAGLVTSQHAEEAKQAVLPTYRHPFPRAAYHLASALAADKANRGTAIRATIDLGLQKDLEALVRRRAEDFGDGATAALMVIDNRSRAVRALIGSSSTDVAGGWIDLTGAVRSPGSALKPFIYALAFDDGLIGPDTVIDDMPRSFGGYSPENFDRSFRGEVRASDALKHSLNVPAVRLLDRLGAKRLAATLRAAGVGLVGPQRADRDFGLSLALGGAGVTLRDLGALYAGLANDGAVTPLIWRQTDEMTDNKVEVFQMFAPETAHRVSEILTDAPALEGRAPASLTVSAPRVAFKTGTSYGYRDAWAAGHAGAYTAAVWVGRADGAPRPGETGRKAAAPILMDVFDIVMRHDPEGAGKGPPAIDDDPVAIARLAAPRRQSPPEIVFPRDGAELFASSPDAGARGFSLSARGGGGDYRWYVDGRPVIGDGPGDRAIWRPQNAGFFDVIVVDGAGRSARAKVRVSLSG